MGELVLNAVPASPGAAAGPARLIDEPFDPGAEPLPLAGRQAEVRRAAAALEQARADLEGVAATLRSAGSEAEAEIVETGALMAQDPALAAAVETLVLERGRPAPAALIEATAVHAAAIQALEDPLLAARADDVRSLGRRAARLALGRPAGHGGGSLGGAILVAAELGPADVAELAADASGIALAAGGVTTHAAIVARSLGLPMVVEAGESLLRAREGDEIVIDGDAGVAVLQPARSRLDAARAAEAARARARARARAERSLPAATRDGRRVSVLVNVASAAEVWAGLDAGAEGVGLLRTELAFLDATAWPAEAEHRVALAPVLAALGGLPATVRVLDFGGDKIPPFLADEPERGTALLLSNPNAFDAQLRAILATAGGATVRILLPMVETAAEVRAARDAVLRALGELPGSTAPLLGAMVETPAAAEAAGTLAAEVDFLSIGTNDLAHSTLSGGGPGPRRAPAHHPRVLALIDRTVRAGHAAGLPVEVCGEAASDPVVAPLLVGLGVDELSVGAARVGALRSWVRALAFADAHEVAERALDCSDDRAVAALVEPLARSLALAEGGDAAAQGVNGRGGVVAVGPKP